MKSRIIASASIAAAIPVEPPISWFDDPKLTGPTPISVDNDGRVYGHLATWETPHVGMSGDIRPPRSASGYAYFHTGVLRTQEGKDVKVGQLTMTGGHAPLECSAQETVKHYDDTASAFADVRAGEDQFGIYVSGALRPGVTPEQIRIIRASATSGDWRSINGNLELLAVCCVNAPGFPVPRLYSLAASAAGTEEPFALVAAGMSTLLSMRDPETLSAEDALRRLDLALGVDEYVASFKGYSPEQRKFFSEKGITLPDGSYPINDVSDLRKAIRACARIEGSKRSSVRRHVIKRARALGNQNLIPSHWRELSLSDEGIAQRDRYDALVAGARAKKVQKLRERISPPQTAEQLQQMALSLRERITK